VGKQTSPIDLGTSQTADNESKKQIPENFKQWVVVVDKFVQDRIQTQK